jgi:hypothetical protein
VDLPLSWAITLAVAGVTGFLAVIGLRVPMASSLANIIPPVTHLLGGGLIGFMSLAFFPALPLVAAIGGMLTVRAIQFSRWTDAALLAVGVGISWTVLLGWRMVTDALDPAVSGADVTVWFLAGAVVLVGALLLLIAVTVWPERFSPR